MNQNLAAAVFQPRPSKQETKADATTRAARDIIKGEASQREAKTERLRAARLAQEAVAQPAPVKKKSPASAKKKTPASAKKAKKA